MSPLIIFIVTLSFGQIFAAVPFYDKEVDIVPLTVDELERLASWTEDDKQNIWELSGQFEGDIVLAPDQRNVVIGNNYRWPNAEIPYEIDPTYTLAQRQWIEHSLTEISNKTCVRPRRKTPSDKDYVYVTPQRAGCFSMLGRRGGKQVLNLERNEVGQGCFRLGTIVHEFLHALGFYHQHCSTERNNYITIMWKNIKEGKDQYFEKFDEWTISPMGQPYDYGSIMHYSAYAFSKNGEQTIVPKDPNAQIGQRVGLSQIDINKLNIMHKCT